jgi:hypothetical protein
MCRTGILILGILPPVLVLVFVEALVGLFLALCAVIVCSSVVSPIVAEAGARDDLVHLPRSCRRRPGG